MILPSPRLTEFSKSGFVFSRVISGRPSHSGVAACVWPDPAPVSKRDQPPGSAGRVTSEIRQQKNQGADVIKVGLVSPEVLFAAIAEGKRVGLPVLGHLQEGVDAAEASRAGFRSIEHFGPGDSIWIGCSTEGAVLLADAAEHPAMKAPPIPIPAFVEKILMKRLQKKPSDQSGNI